MGADGCGCPTATAPQDARVMAWWDYGYQINGVAKRTTIADGNTWNHEHIALLGKCLVSSENVSHPIVRHLADYVLIWTTRCARVGVRGGVWVGVRVRVGVGFRVGGWG